jgi:hypothetical protein
MATKPSEEQGLGTDIYGWIEAYTPEIYPGCPRRWTAVVRIDEIVTRNYGMFGSLFGVRNDCGFRPIAPARGIPDDISGELQEYGDVPPDPGSWPPSWITWREISEIDWNEFGTHPAPGRDVTESARRRDVLSPGWQTVLDVMELWARQFGADGVRMVVWFD